ncbi:MAG: hypothetical protein QOH71_393 [Blastocatellia bacterium]|jgi:hypothetical protein|nr:hypothetical protein [Blastocatellia bacterium]
MFGESDQLNQVAHVTKCRNNEKLLSSQKECGRLGILWERA